MSSRKDAVGKAAATEVKLLWETRQRKLEEEEEAAKARSEITQQEYIQTLTDRYDEDALIKIADYVNRVTGAQQPKCVPPPLPKDKAVVISFLKQYLLYVVKRL